MHPAFVRLAVGMYLAYGALFVHVFRQRYVVAGVAGGGARSMSARAATARDGGGMDLALRLAKAV